MRKLPRQPARLFALWLAAAALVVAADQASKLAMLAHFQPGERLPLTGFFNLVLVYNPGSAFSLLAGAGGWQKWLFTALALAISVWILRALWQQPEQKLQSAALSLVMGGAIGNVIDRLAYGAVVDFLDFYIAHWHWPAFNIADSGICVGAALFLVSGIRGQESGIKTDAAQTPSPLAGEGWGEGAAAGHETTLPQGEPSPSPAPCGAPSPTRGEGSLPQDLA